MKLIVATLTVLCLGAGAAVAAEPKVAVFFPAKDDPIVGDWQGEGAIVAQVSRDKDGAYQANLLKAFDAPAKPVAILKSTDTGDRIAFAAVDGWTATIEHGHLIANNGATRVDLQHITRTSATLGAAPPSGAVVLFDGKNLDAWATKAGKDWLKEAGPASWKLVDGGVVEVVPGADSLISHRKFGDCRLHLEFRTLGAPTNSGAYLQARYEVNIAETYGRFEGGASGSLDNCTDKVPPRVRASLPPLAWQTLDVDFHAPRFDAAGKKTAAAKATVSLNGVKLYEDQELSPPHGAAGRLGEAATGPIMLQEHGMPVQFRNVWVLETSP